MTEVSNREAEDQRIRAFSQLLFQDAMVRPALFPVWDRLQPYLSRLFSVQSEKETAWFTGDLFMSLYTTVFDYCLGVPLDWCVDGISVDREYVLYAALYEFLCQTFSEWCDTLESLDQFLQISQLYDSSSRQIEAIFLYLERHWYGKALLAEPCNKLIPALKIIGLCRRAFEGYFLLPSHFSVSNWMLEAMTVERQTGKIDDNIGRIQSIYLLCTPLVEVKSSHGSSTYLNHMQIAYRDTVASFCRDFEAVHQSQHDISTLIEALCVFREREMRLAARHTQCTALIKACLKKSLLEPFLITLLEAFRLSIESGESDVYMQIYGLFKDHESLLKQLDVCFEHALVARGQVIQDLSTALCELNNTVSLLEGLEHRKEMIGARDRAFSIIFERHDLKRRLPIALARSLTLENLGDSLVLLRYMEEGELFHRVFLQHVAQKIIIGEASKESEGALLLRLKEELGANFVNPIVKLFTDADACQASFTNILVLPHGASEVNSQRIPVLISRQLQAQEQAYHKKFGGRKIKWVAELSTATVRITEGGKEMTLKLNFAQLSLLEGIMKGIESLEEDQLPYLIEADVLHWVDGVLAVNVKNGATIDVSSYKPATTFANSIESMDVEDLSSGPTPEERHILMQCYITKHLKKSRISSQEEIRGCVEQHFNFTLEELEHAINALLAKEYIAVERDAPEIVRIHGSYHSHCNYYRYLP